MLFLTFGNFVMFSIQFISEILRYRCYWRVMQRLLPTGSILVKSTKQPKNKVHKSLLNPSEPERVEYEDDYIQISSLRPMQEVDLSSWTAYTSYLQVHSCVPDTSQNIYVLMEARRPSDLNKFVDNNLRIPPTQRVHVLSLGCPVAWKTAEPFGIILHCNFAGLVAISDAFGQNKITLDEDLELIGLATVKTQSTPQTLVPQLGVVSEDYLVSSTVHNEPENEQSKLNGEACYTESVSSNQKSQLESSHKTAASNLSAVSSNQKSRLESSHIATENYLSAISSNQKSQLDSSHITTENNLSAVSNHIPDSQSEFSSSNNCQLDHTETFLVEQTTKLNATAIRQQQANKSPVSNDTQLKTESSSRESNGQDGSAGSHMKPPNILVYCGIKDSARKFEEVKSSLEACINTEAHTIYHLKHDAVLSAPWRNNAALLLVSSCAHLRPEVEDEIRNFVLKDHGKLLSFNSSVESVFVEKVEEEEGFDGERLIKFDYKDGQLITSVRGRFSYRDLKGNAQVIVPHNFCAAQNNLTEQENEQVEDPGVASSSVPNGALVVKMYCEGGGITVLSQLLLERDPTEYAKDQESFTALKNSNADRLAVLRDILASLGIDTSSGNIPALTPCSLLAQRVGLKESFLESFKHRLKDSILRSQKMSLKFVQSSPTQSELTPALLPVVTDLEYDAHTEYFNPQTYWKHLNTLTLGQMLFYTDVITSTMPVFDGLQFSIPENVGLIAVAGRQTSGRGRGGNSWLSPVGCAMFTLPLSLSLESQLGQRVSFLQHIVSVAVVQSVVTLPGYEDLDIRLKWPNDIYYGKEMKLGGVLVTSTVVETRIYATIGCGFNVSNSNPTICINDIIRLRNISNPHLPELPPLTSSQLIARTVTCLENLIQNFEKDGHEGFCKEYYKHWLHGNCKVNIQLDKATEGVIVGLDDYGFLSVSTPDGVISVQPDGNSFDMLHNLIHVKLQS